VESRREGQHATNAPEQRRHRKVQRRRDAPGGHPCAERRADQGAETPERVEGGHDGPAVLLLDRDRLRIHRHIEAAMHRAEAEQRHGQERGGWGEREHRQEQAVGRRARLRHTRAAEART
jgi:hypothetical protein